MIYNSRKKVTVEEYANSPGAYTIVINNARYHENFAIAINKLIKTFMFEKETFFGLCRTDGLNLTLEKQKKLDKSIPAFFRENGDFQILNEYLTVARTCLDNEGCNFVSSVFDYYLETIMFNSKVDWDAFKGYYYNYQEHRFDEFIRNRFSEMLFFYFDSGDFLVCFNPEIYKPVYVRGVIDLLFGL